MLRTTRTLIGVLAFQGDFAEHIQTFREMGVSVKSVRSCDDLHGVTHVVIPGGESSVIGKFIAESGIGRCIIDAYRAGTLALWGTCAGAILLGKSNSPFSLGIAHVVLERNAYGSQLHSFTAALSLNTLPTLTVQGIFIRAPKIINVEKNVEIFASHSGLPVLCKDGKMLLSTFHPELTSEKHIQSLFLKFNSHD